MLSYYCLKCRKNTESKNPKVSETKREELCFYQNVQCMIVKNRNLLKSETLEDAEGTLLKGAFILKLLKFRNKSTF